jgi:hypothetical protein
MAAAVLEATRGLAVMVILLLVLAVLAVEDLVGMTTVINVAAHLSLGHSALAVVEAWGFWVKAQAALVVVELHKAVRAVRAVVMVVMGVVVTSVPGHPVLAAFMVGVPVLTEQVLQAHQF